ncbi:hypothetical protein DFH09DRAFT_1083927 [Mycena vulgaris]|nr:hypothetical protein DFH09DRAFT_1083927 [Mycena vulgaris]
MIWEVYMTLPMRWGQGKHDAEPISCQVSESVEQIISAVAGAELVGSFIFTLPEFNAAIWNLVFENSCNPTPGTERVAASLSAPQSLQWRRPQREAVASVTALSNVQSIIEPEGGCKIPPLGRSVIHKLRTILEAFIQGRNDHACTDILKPVKQNKTEQKEEEKRYHLETGLHLEYTLVESPEDQDLIHSHIGDRIAYRRRTGAGSAIQQSIAPPRPTGTGKFAVNSNALRAQRARAPGASARRRPPSRSGGFSGAVRYSVRKQSPNLCQDDQDGADTALAVNDVGHTGTVWYAARWGRFSK